MSVIHEALKKTGNPIMTETQNNAADNKTGFRPEFLSKKKGSKVGPLVALGVLALVISPIAAPLLNGSGKTSPTEISVGSSMPVSGNMKKQFAIEVAPLPTMASPSRSYSGRMPRFTLSGLVYSAGGSYGLINEKVVRVGERIGEATLIQITPTQAVLDYRGETVVLTANEG